MNNKQKLLTYFAVAAIGLTILFTPWDLTGSPDHYNVTKFSPLFVPPDSGPWAKRELATSAFWSWLAIGAMYSLLFVAFRETVTVSQKQTLEQVSSA